MSWEGIVLIIIVVWALIHTMVDMQVKKKVEDLAKNFEAHKH
jgi:hypothetical protein